MAKKNKKKNGKKAVAKADFVEVTAAGGNTMTSAFTEATMESTAENIKKWRHLLQDHQVSSAWQQRQDSLIAIDWEIVPGGEDQRDLAAAEFLKEQVTRIGFDQITRKMHFAQFYGHAVAECLWAQDGPNIVLDAIKVRAPERFKWSSKTNQLMFMGGNDPQGEPLPEYKMWVYAIPGDSDDVPHGAALGWRLYWPVFLKENGAKFWAVALEKYGMPTALGKYPVGSEQEDINKLLLSLMAIHSQSAVAFPEGFEAELLQSMRSSGGDYETFQGYWDKAVSKIILSQTMTTDDGSSKSQADVHMNVRDGIIQADSDLICDSFNRGPAKWLTEWNFPGAKPPQFWRRIKRAEDLGKRAKRDDALARASGLRPSKAYIEETYGGEWEMPSSPVQPAKPKSKQVSFADSATDPDEIDSLTDQLDDMAAPATADLFDNIKGILETSKNLEQAQERLLQLAADSDNDPATDVLTSGFALADLTGRASVE